MLQKRMGAMVSEAGAPYRFAPPEGPSFFERYGWTPIEVQSIFEAAARTRNQQKKAAWEKKPFVQREVHCCNLNGNGIIAMGQKY